MIYIKTFPQWKKKIEEKKQENLIFNRNIQKEGEMMN